MIRQAKQSDAPTIHRIACNVSLQGSVDEHRGSQGFLISSYSLDDYTAFINNSLLYVEVNQQQPIGFLMIWQNESPTRNGLQPVLNSVSWVPASYEGYQSCLYIAQVAVDPKFRRTGVASRLHMKAFAEYSEESWLVSIVEKPIRNHASIAFYTSFGFLRVGHRTSKHPEAIFSTYTDGWYVRT